MKIAILGWGSLIWDPKQLEYEKDFDWDLNGPRLPIEYARISRNGRLTLVIADNVKEVKTLFAISSKNNLAEAIQNLRLREETSTTRIGFYDKSKKQFHPEEFKYKSNILDWIEQLKVDAVIWTNLEENWKEKTEDRISYLKSLENNELALAKEYVAKTPAQIETELRSQIKKELNW